MCILTGRTVNNKRMKIATENGMQIKLMQQLKSESDEPTLPVVNIIRSNNVRRDYATQKNNKRDISNVVQMYHRPAL